MPAAFDHARQPSPPGLARGSRLVLLILIGTIAVQVAWLRWEGRRWWCRLRDWSFWSSGINSVHTSQHPLDPYSFTHLVHGVLFYAVLWLVLPRLRWHGRLLATVLLEVAWELAENSAPFIARYRATTIAVGYVGDSVANSLGDVASCVAGFLLTRRLEVGWTIALVVAIETTLILTVRDSLLLNIVTLIHPFPAIRAWQGGVAGGG